MRGVQHRCIEANELEDVGKAHDLVQEREIPITLSPGRHAMDTMISFYLRTPTGFDVEFGANGELIDDATFVQTNPSYSQAWGHRTITPRLGTYRVGHAHAAAA
jgi:extradiol dioxygenase